MLTVVLQQIMTAVVACTMLFAPGQISKKELYVAFFVPIDCIRLARYCGKKLMYSRHVFPLWIIDNDKNCQRNT